MTPIRATDTNHASIMQALRQIGCSVQSLHIVGRGCPDILVGFETWDGVPINLLMEIKNGHDAKLTPAEVRWHDRWRGQVTTVRTREQAVMIVQGYKEDSDDVTRGSGPDQANGSASRAAAQGCGEGGER